MGASWDGSWQGTKWGWCASHLCSCSRCLQVPASTGALRGGTGPKWYSGRTACGLALGGWEGAEGVEAGRGGLVVGAALVGSMVRAGVKPAVALVVE